MSFQFSSIFLPVRKSHLYSHACFSPFVSFVILNFIETLTLYTIMFDSVFYHERFDRYHAVRISVEAMLKPIHL